ncbi:MAG: hypothetical protein WA633_04315 [Stellaceae bacterium]
MERPIGLARSVPRDEHPYTDVREGAGRRDDENRPSGSGDDMLPPSQVTPSGPLPRYYYGTFR